MLVVTAFCSVRGVLKHQYMRSIEDRISLISNVPRCVEDVSQSPWVKRCNTSETDLEQYM
jgi:hypothetical protein